MAREVSVYSRQCHVLYERMLCFPAAALALVETGEVATSTST